MSLQDFLWTASLDILSRRDHSSAELQQKLQAKLHKLDADGVTEEEQTALIAQTVEKLKTLDLLDDNRFARTWVESRLRLRPRGPLLLKQELTQKGIPDSLASAILTELFPGENQLAAARALITRRSNKTREQNQRFLASKGFSFAVIREAVG